MALKLAGQRFGRLTVLSRAKTERRSRGFQWTCLCDCGNKKIITAKGLSRGTTKSCGCLHREMATKYPQFPPAFNNLFGSRRAEALRRGREFYLTREECFVLASSNCYYCGSKPGQIVSCGKKKNNQYPYTFISNGIDRVDNNIGYTSTNSVACCKVCNRAKNTMTKQDFLIWVNRISIYQNNNIEPGLSAGLLF